MKRGFASSELKGMEILYETINHSQERKDKGSLTKGSQYEGPNQPITPGLYPTDFSGTSAIRKTISSPGLLTRLIAEVKLEERTISEPNNTKLAKECEDYTPSTLINEDDNQMRMVYGDLEKKYINLTAKSARALEDYRSGQITREKYLQIDYEAIKAFNAWNAFDTKIDKLAKRKEIKVFPFQSTYRPESSEPPPIE